MLPARVGWGDVEVWGCFQSEQEEDLFSCVCFFRVKNDKPGQSNRAGTWGALQRAPTCFRAPSSYLLLPDNESEPRPLGCAGGGFTGPKALRVK